MSGRRYAAAIAALVIGGTGAAMHDRAAGLPGGLAHRQHVTEDSPGWNCHTMGNHVCGPAAYPGWEKP